MKHKWQFFVQYDCLNMNFDEVKEITGDKTTLTDWLLVDVGDYIGYLEDIDTVLDGKSEEEVEWGNAYKAYVRKDYTEIHSCFEEVGSPIKPCTVPTKLLREIVKAWLDELEKFKASRK